MRQRQDCLISSFYIKPQRYCAWFYCTQYCLISSFYIKPQHGVDSVDYSLIVLYRLSTSNHNFEHTPSRRVYIVLYRLSTSNHNCYEGVVDGGEIVLYRLSTSNHNRLTTGKPAAPIVLYRLSTSNHNLSSRPSVQPPLSYIVFLHQTTTSRDRIWRTAYCLISSFYIKPQQVS